MTTIEVKLTANFDRANLTLKEFTDMVTFLTNGEPAEAIKWMVSNPNTLQKARAFESLTIADAFTNETITGLQTLILHQCPPQTA